MARNQQSGNGIGATAIGNGPCWHCKRALDPCPHGLACRRFTLTGAGPCPDCRYGVRCPIHGRHWIGP